MNNGVWLSIRKGDAAGYVEVQKADMLFLLHVPAWVPKFPWATWGPAMRKAYLDIFVSAVRDDPPPARFRSVAVVEASFILDGVKLGQRVLALRN